MWIRLARLALPVEVEWLCQTHERVGDDPGGHAARSSTPSAYQRGHQHHVPPALARHLLEKIALLRIPDLLAEPLDLLPTAILPSPRHVLCQLLRVIAQMPRDDADPVRTDSVYVAPPFSSTSVLHGMTKRLCSGESR